MNMHLFISITTLVFQELCYDPRDTVMRKIDTIPGLGVKGKTLRHNTNIVGIY